MGLILLPGAVRGGCVAAVAMAMLCAPVWGQGGGQLPKANLPVAVSWLSFEPEIANFPPTARFTNQTKVEVRVIYGAEKFSLKPGEGKSVPIPNLRRFDLKVYQVKKGQLFQVVESKATPNDQKHQIPVEWEVPRKKQVL